MARLGHFVILLLFIFRSGHLLSQSGENSPAIYDQFFNNYYLVNPASQENNERFAVRLGNRTLTGLFKGVNRFYADANLTLFARNENQQHSIGLFAMNNRDGDYFQRNRFYGRYSIQTKLTDLASLSAGISVGFVNYTFGSSVASAGGSSAAPDANVGLWYLREKFKLGASYQQIFSPQVQPLAQLFILNRYLNVNGIYRIDFGLNAFLKTHAYWKYEPNMPFYGEIAPILTVHEWLDLGVNCKYDRGVAVLLGFPKIPIGKGNLYFMASYLISTRKLSSQNDSVLEFALGYILGAD